MQYRSVSKGNHFSGPKDLSSSGSWGGSPTYSRCVFELWYGIKENFRTIGKINIPSDWHVRRPWHRWQECRRSVAYKIRGIRGLWTWVLIKVVESRILPWKHTKPCWKTSLYFHIRGWPGYFGSGHAGLEERLPLEGRKWEGICKNNRSTCSEIRIYGILKPKSCKRWVCRRSTCASTADRCKAARAQT